MEGQIISLEDGSIVVVQGISYGEIFSIIIVIMVYFKYLLRIYLVFDFFLLKYLYFVYFL